MKWSGLERVLRCRQRYDDQEDERERELTDRGQHGYTRPSSDIWLFDITKSKMSISDFILDVEGYSPSLCILYRLL